jgi:hypothetical protein
MITCYTGSNVLLFACSERWQTITRVKFEKFLAVIKAFNGFQRLDHKSINANFTVLRVILQFKVSSHDVYLKHAAFYF